MLSNSKNGPNKEQSFWLSSLWLHFSTTWWQSTSIRLPLTSKSWLQVNPVLLMIYFFRYPLHHMFTIFRTLWQVPKLYPKPLKHYNKYNRCLSSLQDLCVERSPRPVELFALAAGKCIHEWWHLLKAVHLTFLKNRWCCVPNYQLARRGEQPATSGSSPCLLCALFSPAPLSSLPFCLCPSVPSSPVFSSPSVSAPPLHTVAVRHWRDVWPAEQIESDICQTWGDLVGQRTVCPPARLCVCEHVCVFTLPPSGVSPGVKTPDSRLSSHTHTHTPTHTHSFRFPVNNKKESVGGMCVRVCVKGCWGLWTVWYLVCHLVHKMKLQAKSQYPIMLILAYLVLLPLTATFLWFGRGTRRCSLAGINPEPSSRKTYPSSPCSSKSVFSVSKF